jgi:hypothetical protein
MMVNGELLRRKLAMGKSACPELLVDGSTRGRLLHVDGKTLVLFSDVVIVKSLWWRRSTVSIWHGEK